MDRYVTTFAQVDDIKRLCIVWMMRFNSFGGAAFGAASRSNEKTFLFCIPCGKTGYSLFRSIFFGRVHLAAMTFTKAVSRSCCAIAFRLYAWTEISVAWFIRRVAIAQKSMVVTVAKSIGFYRLVAVCNSARNSFPFRFVNARFFDSYISRPPSSQSQVVGVTHSCGRIFILASSDGAAFTNANYRYSKAGSAQPTDGRFVAAARNALFMDHACNHIMWRRVTDRAIIS